MPGMGRPWHGISREGRPWHGISREGRPWHGISREGRPRVCTSRHVIMASRRGAPSAPWTGCVRAERGWRRPYLEQRVQGPVLQNGPQQRRVSHWTAVKTLDVVKRVQDSRDRCRQNTPLSRHTTLATYSDTKANTHPQFCSLPRATSAYMMHVFTVHG